ncbi:hypothetical protein O3P69_011894 [Scylla paramamosain]|uniref:FLYWCH-type domain-containing protein n=1 Tax=Scylla paramamosain TaxID=85552 RepID=A0AAW0S9V0_SCYPA
MTLPGHQETSKTPTKEQLTREHQYPPSQHLVNTSSGALEMGNACWDMSRYFLEHECRLCSEVCFSITYNSDVAWDPVEYVGHHSQSNMPHTILSSRGREKLVDDLNFIYAAQKKNADGTKQYWRCEVTAWKARVHTTIGDETFTIVKSVNEHNHSTTAAAVKAREAMAELKAVDASTQESSRALVANVLSKLDEHSLAHVPSTSTMSRYVRQWRQDALQAPPIQQTHTGYVIP